MSNKWNSNSCSRGRTLIGVTRKVGRQSPECVSCETCVQRSEEPIKNNMRQKTLHDLYVYLLFSSDF